MSDVSFDDITLPNGKPIPVEARPTEPVVWKFRSGAKYYFGRESALRRVCPWLLMGFAIGLVPVSLAAAVMFLVDYAYLGGLWYALGVAGGAAYVGGTLAVVGVLCLRRLR